MKAYLHIFIALILATLGCTSKHSQKVEIEKSLAATANQLVSENQIPGISISVILSNSQQICVAAGYSDVKSNVPLTVNHVMFSGSIGKTYAAALAMKLVDEGKLSLDSRVMDYFTYTPWLSQIPNIDKLTALMLLQHTTGLPRYEMKPEVWTILRDNPDKEWTYMERLSHIFDDAPIHEPGEGWHYSDTNYILLGMLIEKITDSNYYSLLSQQILNPMKLLDTYPATSRVIEGLPNGYSRLPEWFHMPEEVVTNGAYAFNPQMEWTGGGIASTTANLARWCYLYYSGELFSQQMLSTITTPHEHGHNVMPNMSYGAGSFIYHTKYGNAFGHSGFVPGFNSLMAYFPEQKVSIAFQINCDYATTKISLIDYLNSIADEVLGKTK